MIIAVLLVLAILLSLSLSWHYIWGFASLPDPEPVGKGISLLVPFTSDDGRRQETWEWLKDFYTVWLPGVEIVTHGNKDVPFCKTAAVNDAFWKCTGDVIVILDADCYIDPDVLVECARKIRSSKSEGNKLWYIPYRKFYRLTEKASNKVLESSPTDPFMFADPPPADALTTGRGTSNGHWFGALIQMMPREAFEEAGGMDERFKGWGGEDVSFMRAVDTAFAKHKTWNGPVFHLWHPSIKNPYDGDLRIWEGQEAKKHENDMLMGRYYAAFGDKSRMRRLISEHSWVW